MVLGLGLVAGMFLLTYLLLDPAPNGLYWDDQAKQSELKHLETKLRGLEKDLASNQDIINEIKSSVKEILAVQDAHRKTGDSSSGSSGGAGAAVSSRGCHEVQVRKAA